MKAFLPNGIISEWLINIDQVTKKALVSVASVIILQVITHTLNKLECRPFPEYLVVVPTFKWKAKLANESTPAISLPLSFFPSSMSLSCACCHGDMTRKQRRSDET